MNPCPTRILMTTDAREGVWTYTMELARALQAGGIGVLLAVMGPELSPRQRAEAARLDPAGLCARPFALEWMQDPWRDVTRAGDWLLELEDQFSPQVVHLNHYCHGSLPWTAPVLISAHGCVLSGWQAVHGEQAPHAWTRYHAEVAAGVRGANLVTASTRAMLDSLTRLYAPIPRLLHSQNAPKLPELRTVPHGLDAACFRPMPKRDMVFCVGESGGETQNFEMLNTIAERLPWPVVMGAEGAAGARVFPALQCVDASDPALLSQHRAEAAVFAAPCRYEAFGFEELKAALAGCALVLGDIPCLRETWGDAALFASPDDGEAFGAALNSVVCDTGLRLEMARRARERALELTPERMAGGILECYQTLMARQVTMMESVYM